MKKKAIKACADIILEFMSKRQQEGLDAVSEIDLRDDINRHFTEAIKQLQAEGLIYQPRHYFLKLVQKKVK